MVLLRCLTEYRGPWRVWLPLLVITAVLPFALLGMPLVEKALIDDIFIEHRLDLLPQAIAVYGLLWLVATTAGVVRGALGTYLGEAVSLQLRQRMFDHFGALSLAFGTREHSGRSMALFNNDAPRMAGIFSTVAIGGLAGIVGTVLGALLMFSLSWQLAIVTAVAPPLAGALGLVVTRPLRPMSWRVQEKAAELSEHLHENLAGIREVAAFGQEAAQGGRFATTLTDLLRLRMRLTFMDAAFQTGQSVFSLAVFVAILGYGGYLVLHGETTLGTVIAMRGLFNQTFMTAKQLFGLVKDLQTSLASVERVYTFLDEQPRVQEQPDARAPVEVRGEITFEEVSFAYEPGLSVLENISFRVAAGEMVALVGPSGAGKTTLTSLLTRFYDPSQGRVLLDGIDLRELTLEGLRRNIGIVFQDTFLFANTIRANIAFGREGATDAEIMAAASAANAWEFIRQLPSGLNTYVGQRGVQLSEGQRQRLAIARAFLRDPRILILDEPTSALDARSEQLVQTALITLTLCRTTFVIAHRLATIQRASRIVVLEGGRLVEQGTHTELVARGGLYHQLYELQFGALTGRQAA